GLGAALWIPTAHGPVVLPTEAGQPTLAASTELEMAIVRHMQRDRAHVSIEHAISGPGLMNLYRAVCALQGQAPSLTSPDAVTAAAMADSDAHARQALDVFCGLLGSTIGDMALFYGAHGGVYLAGGILPQIREYLHASTFVERYLQKGPMGEALARIPVKVVEHGQLGVVGAASWYLQQSAA
ncbi:glucokinase, partial [Stenotrophomonas maltophilia]